MTRTLGRTEYSRRLVGSLLDLLDGPADEAMAALSAEERAALLAAAHDYAELEPESCTRCGRRLEWLIPDDPSEYSYDRGLRLVATGGYGMFIDPMMEGNPEILLCHECAHAVCAAMPWLAAAIGAGHGHSDGSHADPAETAAWPTLQEAVEMLGVASKALSLQVDAVVEMRTGIKRVRPSVLIELARRTPNANARDVAAALVDLATKRAPEHVSAIEAEVRACFIDEDFALDDPESTRLFLAAVRRLSPAWADRLDDIYREGPDASSTEPGQA